MSDKSKKLRDQAHTRKVMRREAETAPRPFIVRCAYCRKAESEVVVLIEMGSFVACDQCIELAARAVKLRKGR